MATNERKGSLDLMIQKDSFHCNGKLLLDTIPSLESRLRTALSSKIDVILHKKENGNIGVNAKSLNVAIRGAIKKTKIDINEETYVENGVFFQTGGNKGFDFAIYDEDYNEARLFNYYVGMIGILDGKSKIETIYKKLKLDRNAWMSKLESLYKERGAGTGDLVRNKKSLTVVGEIQFGNWALAYRDLFRLMNADNDPGVDLYIYITSVGELASMLSANTVRYDEITGIIKENANILRVPMWIIGLDIKSYSDDKEYCPKDK